MPTTLLCLHGWGGSKESFTELREGLQGTDITILTPDLPGFGDEPEPKEPWTTDDYVEWVVKWFQANKPPLPNPLPSGEGKMRLFILGHSHGGRIALKIASQELLPIDNLFLCAAAGVKHPRHIKRIFGLTLAKAGKFLLRIPGLKMLQPIGKKLLYKLVRVHDYEKASPIMRQTLINVSKEDLKPLLPSIRIPTDIFWGEDDRMTPIGDAHVMHTLIMGSRLHVYPGVRHAVHRDRAWEIAQLVHSALQ